MTGSFLLSISGFFVFSSFITLLFGSVQQSKLAIRQLFGSRKYPVSYRVVSCRCYGCL